MRKLCTNVLRIKISRQFLDLPAYIMFMCTTDIQDTFLYAVMYNLT